MKVTVCSILEYRVEIPEPLILIPILMALSRAHYDMVCRQASDVATGGFDPYRKRNGFLKIWSNQLAMDYPHDKPGDPFIARMRESELQTLMKIMEMAGAYLARKPHEMARVVRFRDSLNSMRRGAKEAAKDWQKDLDV